MGLLEEIRAAAVRSNSDMGELLRNCLVLAADLKSGELRSWVERELNGYSERDELPEYRFFAVQSVGILIGPYGSRADNVSLPIAHLPQEFRERLRGLRFQQPIGTYAKIVNDGKDNGSLRAPWPPDVIAALAGEFYENMTLFAAWQPFPVGVLHSIVESVRNRVLDFVLQLVREAPASHGDAKSVAQEVPADRITQIFHTNVYGVGSNVAVGSSNFSQQSVPGIVKGDLGGLKTYLTTAGVATSDVDALEDAIQKDPVPATKGRFGARVAAWIGSMMQKAATGAWDVAAGTGGNLLAEALSKYYGW